jgi:hypothetical protein
MDSIKTLCSAASELLPRVIDYILGAPNTSRKVIIQLCRFGGYPEHKGALHSMVSNIRDDFVIYMLQTQDRLTRQQKDDTCYHNPRAQEVEDLFINPVTAGLIIHLCCILPLSAKEISDEQLASYIK